ncbi:hypothetical protein AB0L10_26145 [Streptomyces flaveolus]|uniref:hypothetical protein n=1 Tax=Streptomyces flaveolus TaxID=67297 RepID=UPI00343AED94
MIGLLLLQLLAAIAEPCWFLRIRHTEGAVRTVVAPVLAAALLVTAIALVVSHIDLFTAASPAVNVLLVAVAPAVFALGLPLAWWLRRSRPDATFGTENTETTE